MQQLQQETETASHIAEGAGQRQTIGVEIVTPTETEDAALQTLFTRARSRDTGERQAALRALQGRGVEGLPTLMELFRAEMRGQQRRKRLRRWAFITGACCYLVDSNMGLFFATRFWFIPIIFLALTLVSAVTLVCVWRLILNSRQQEIAAVLAQIDDARAIGTLIEAMTYEGAQIPAVRDTLIKLLRRIRPSDAGLIDRARRTALYEMLNDVVRDGAQVAMSLAILAAIEQLGDAEALPYVRRLCQRSAWTPGQRTVHLRAEECLRDWETTQAQARGGTTLLRAAQSPVDSPDVLLRSVDADPLHASEQLLRSSEGLETSAMDVSYIEASGIEVGDANTGRNLRDMNPSDRAITDAAGVSLDAVEMQAARGSEHDHAQ